MKTLINYPKVVPVVLYALLLLLCLSIGVESGKDCGHLNGKRLSTSKLVCYYGTLEEVDGCHCTHVILPANADVKGIEGVKKRAQGVKVYVSVNEFNQGLIDLIKSSKVDGLELNLKKLDSKNDISDFISTVKTKLGSDLDIALSVPSRSDLVAKYFDFKALSKHTDMFILQTAFLGASTNVTFHPSRLSGMWDMQNTDSVVDLVTGLGAPLSKLVIAAPVQAFQFTLQNEEFTAPGSPALELTSITRTELCKLMHDGKKNWTLERDEDQAGPYIFSKNQWIAFDDSKSMDIKAKYSRIRGLAGLALKDLAQDGGADCGSTILEAAYNGLSRQARAPRGAVLHSLEREIVDSSTKPLDSVQLSPYKISRIIDTEGKIHVTRQDTRTEFQCSRQGYFVHPRSCNRFYRCVKFDQLTENYNVFEFDCPAGLAFDERVEVCVWPGSLPHGTPCSGSSEIAPVPKERFVCPSEPGYYADPENCRWFYACLDHGKSSALSAYEFRCPFGLVFDGDRLVCEWSWLVPKCAGGLGTGQDSAYYYGEVGDGIGKGLGGGYAVKGSQSSGLTLQSYDGLGTLSTIKLGGISGKFDKPISTVYSNVGTGSLGSGYQNSGGYIEGGGLTYKATQSLQDAGLLRVNNGFGYQAADHNDQGTLYATAQPIGQTLLVNEHGNAYAAAGQSKALADLQGTVAGYQGAKIHLGQTNLVGTDGYITSGGSVLHGTGAIQGAVSTQSFTQYHGAGKGSEIYQGNSGYGNTGSTNTQGSSGYVNVGSAANNQGTFGHGYVESAANVEGSSGYVNVGSVNTQGSYGYANLGSSNTHGSSGHGYIGSSANVEGSSGYVNVGSVDTQGSSGYANLRSSNTQGSSGYVNVESAANTQGTSGQGYIESSANVEGSSGYVNLGSVKTQESSGYANIGSANTHGSSGYVNVGSVANSQGTFDHGYVGSAANVEGSSGYVNVGSTNTQGSYSGYDNVGSALNIQGNSGYGNVESAANVEGSSGYINVGSVNNQESSGYVNVGSTNNQESSGYVNTGSYATGANDYLNKDTSGFGVRIHGLSQNSAGGAVSSQSFTQYNGQEAYKNSEQFGSGIAENINIVGGGVSVVGPLSPRIAITNNGESNGITGSPAYVSVTNAPSVTKIASPSIVALPVPGIKTSLGFETINGGVIANIPELQYRAQSLEEAGLLSNFSSSFANFVVTSPATNQNHVTQQTYFQNGNGFENHQQDILNTVGISTARPFVSVSTGEPHQVYISSTARPVTIVEQRPDVVNFQEVPVVYSTPKPVTLVQPAVSSVISQGYGSNGGYSYEKPSVEFEDKPQGLIVNSYSTTPKPAVIIEQQPQIVVSSTPAPLVSTYNTYNDQINVDINQSGYVYNKPSVTFEERPQTPTIISKFSIRKPVATTQGGYYYEKPSVKFEERPVVVQQTIANEIPTVQLKQKTVLEDYTYQKPAVVSQYYYQQPVVQKQPVIPLYRQPERLSTYTYQPAVQRPVSRYTYQNVAQQAVGVSYKTPQITLVQKPVQNYAYQPSGGSSYQYTKLENTQRQASNVQSQGGYVYSKPSIEFEEKPKTYKYSTPEPSIVVQEPKGYVYDKPVVAFEETPVTYSTAKPALAVQPAVVTSYFNIGGYKNNAETVVQQENVGYTYPKPTVHFEETPVTYSTSRPVAEPVKPATATSYFNIASSKANSDDSVVQTNVGYTYPKPNVHFEETPVTYSTPKPFVAQPDQPAVVSSYYNIANSQANSESVAQQQKVGYSYPKPAVRFEETPVTYSTPRPFVVQPVESFKPAVATSYFKIASSKANSESSIVQQQDVGYNYPKPAIQYEETPVIYSTPKSVVVQPVTYSTPRPFVVQPEEHVIPAEVTNYFNIASSKANSESVVQQQNIGYTYPKPSVQFQEAPETYSTAKPVVVQHIKQAQPAVVTGYFNIGNTKADSQTIVNQERVGYTYPKPSVQFEETPVIYSTPKPAVAVQPAVITSYFNIGSSTPKLDAYEQEENIGYNYPQPEIKFKETPVVYSTSKPAVVSSYSYLAPSTPKPVVVEENVGYAYPKPEIRFEEPSQVIVEATPKPAVVTSYYHQQPSKGYEYPKPSVQLVEEPRQPVQEVPFVKKTAYVTGQYQQNSQDNYNYQQDYQQAGKVVVENYQFPDYEKVKQTLFGQKIYQQQDQVQYEQPQVVLNYVQSTPKPTFVSTIRNIARKKLQPVSQAKVTFYDSRYTSTPNSYVSSTVAPEAPVVVSTTSKPVSRYAFSSLDDQYQYNDIVKSTTFEPIRTYLPVTSTVRVITSALPRVTKGKIVEEFIAPEVTTLSRDYLPVRARTKAPSREYLPVEVTTPSNEYLPVPTREYLPARRIKVTTEAPEITTLSRDYLPVKTRVRITTTGAPLEDHQTYTIRPRRPSTIKVTRPVTVIKKNDAHPLLSAKLGAQCTCVSNTLTLRKKQKIVIVDDDDDDDEGDDGYIVDNGEDGNVVESYSYEPRRVVDITPVPEVYSTAEPQVLVKKRVKVRPVTRKQYYPVTEVSEIFYQKNTSPALIVDDEAPSDREIAKAVRTGLKLVKQAAKQGAKEGTEEAISKQFDRYGPGGVRSKSETLQGTIDCQRAGLFRHPSECNKFYACRWDCTKNRFTLHIFNCPVHLTFDNTLGACNWPSQGPACVENTLITSD